MKYFGKAVGRGERSRRSLWMGVGPLLLRLSAHIRYPTTGMHPFEIAFFRNLFGLAVMLPWLCSSGLAACAPGG